MNYLLDINWFAALGAALLNMVIGFLWYGPIFGKAWLAASGKKMEDINKSEANKAYMISGALALITSFALAFLIINLGIVVWWKGAALGALIWLGFVATTMYASVLFENKNPKLYWINSLYQLTALVAMALTLTIWR